MAVWKPKEIPLTQEEAIDLAKKDLAPFWFGSEPLLAALPLAKKIIAYPLSPKISLHSWILLFVDPTNFSTEGTLLLAKEWFNRYSRHNVQIILCVRPPFQVLRQPEQLALFLKKNPQPFAAMLDHNGMLSAAFSAKEFPKVIFLNQGQTIFEEQGGAHLTRFEKSLQPFLRKTDPGLSLPFPLETLAGLKQDLAPYDFSESKIDPSTSKKPEINFGISGTWTRTGERITTSDPEATITLRSAASFLSIIAQAPAVPPEGAEIEIELDAKPPFETILGQDLRLSDNGRAVVTIREPRVYQLLAQMSSQTREIKLRFPSAARCPVELFGLRSAL